MDGYSQNFEITYRVVGVRQDGSRAVMGSRLKRAQADRLKQLLVDSRAFPAVELEADDNSAHTLDVQPFSINPSASNPDLRSN